MKIYRYSSKDSLINLKYLLSNWDEFVQTDNIIMSILIWSSGESLYKFQID